MDKFSKEVIRLVEEKKTVKEIYAELDRRSRIYKEALRIIEEIPQLLKYIDSVIPITLEEFEQRLTKFEEQLK